MNRCKSVISAIVIGLFVTACATALTKDIKVDTETAPNANLSAYKTYAWIAAAQILNDPDGQWEPRKFDADAEIRFLINNELRKKGMTEVDRNPDMLGAPARNRSTRLESMVDGRGNPGSGRCVPRSPRRACP